MLIELPAGTRLVGQSARITHVFFPTTAVCSIAVKQVLELCRQHDGFRKALSGYAAFRLHLASRPVACNSFHSIQQRLARWLLFAHDRARRSDFRLTHEVLSAMLVATRPRVSQAAAKLKRAGIIDYRHGTVRILDRKRLEAVSCECYEETKSALPT
ncbi:MAG: hypothetical protein A3G81_11360 [Betaproteobacteria bacterium RIFCSPLOWO2_12_FULL_65_14]|nr:MAG: hypothetical protein A3G81_11360 [Betaproteobacteria bacterium RIFCSPLOWO2_12_FULL_65_14]